jgi:hypothetical protein
MDDFDQLFDDPDPIGIIAREHPVAADNSALLINAALPAIHYPDFDAPVLAPAGITPFTQPVSIKFHKTTKGKLMLHLDNNEFFCTNVNSYA